MLIVGNHHLLADAAYYANWLSIVYGLKDRSLKNLLVFLPKIEDLTLLTLVCLQTKGKREKWLYFALKSPFRKYKAYLWLFRRLWMQNRKWVHGFLAYNWVTFDFGRAISFLPSFSFTLMRVYMNTGIK